MNLPVKDFRSLVRSMTTAWATQLGLQPIFGSGDPLLAMLQSVAAQMIFIQAEAQLVNAVARAQTSAGADLDTFYGQFGFTRLPGILSSGEAVFTKFTPAATQVLVPAGTILQTPGGAIQYQAVADPGQPTWNAILNAYVLLPGQTSLTATIDALTPGASQNVSAGQLSQIASSLSGIDEATNPLPISNGTDPEPDPDFSARFLLFINSLSKAIKAAIIEAIITARQGVKYLLIENQNFYGSPYPFTDDLTFTTNRPAFSPMLVIQPGIFIVLIDDGSGNPPPSLLKTISDAVNAVRGFTIQYRVMAPTIVLANVAMTLSIDPAATRQTVVGAVSTALTAFLNTVPLGTQLVPLARLQQIAFDASPSVLNVTDVKVNGVPIDLVLTRLQVVKAGTMTID